MLTKRWMRILLSVVLVGALGVGVVSWNVQIETHRLELNLLLADAVKRDDLPAISRLLASGADSNVPTDYFPQAETFVERLKRILLRKPVPINGKGETALFRASAHGDVRLMRALLARGADLNRTVEPGYTALHLAAGMEDSYELDHKLVPPKGRVAYEACELLLDTGADPNAGNPYDGTPLRYAIWQKNDALIRLFLDHGAKWSYHDRFTLTNLWDAVEYNRPWLVRKWLAEGANPNERESRHNVNVLMVAVERNELEIVRMLLDAGANPNTVDDGQIDVSPLYQAVEKRSPDLVRLLLEHGARPDLLGGYMIKRATPLQLAAQKGDREVLRLLGAAMKHKRAGTK